MIELAAEKRDIFGKKLLKKREEGFLPAVLYGPKEPSTSVFIKTREFEKVWKEAGETSVVSLSIGDNKKDVLIHAVHSDPVSSTPRHVDFYAVLAGQKIQVNVPIEFTGTAPAVKELGGTLVKVLHEIEIEAEPARIPHELYADISILTDFDAHITAGDLSIPEGAELITPPEEVVALVSEPKEEEEEEAPEADLSSIEVEKKGKKDVTEEGVSKEETTQ